MLFICTIEKIEAKLLAWKQTPNHKPLIIKGVRQCGKTSSVKQFAAAHYESVIYMDFHEQKELRTKVSREEDDYRRMYNLLTLNQAQVLRAVAQERIVAEIGAREFVRKHNLPAASSIKRATDWLLDNEYLYHTENGYIVYDRFLPFGFAQQFEAEQVTS